MRSPISVGRVSRLSKRKLDLARKIAQSTVDRFRKRLEDERARLLTMIDEYEQELEGARLSESSSDRSPDPGNAEASSAKLEYAKELSIEQNTVDVLSKVEHALERVEEGTYGTCEVCGRTIPMARLDVLPYTTFCVDHAKRA
jgi:RNA polymerase-binding transcription factor